MAENAAKDSACSDHKLEAKSTMKRIIPSWLLVVLALALTTNAAAQEGGQQARHGDSGRLRRNPRWRASF